MTSLHRSDCGQAARNLVERALEPVSATIVSVLWRRQRCRVSVRTTTPGLRIDMRRNWKQPDTTIVSTIKELDPKGDASLVVEDDSLEGSAVTLVVIDPNGSVLDRRSTTVGGES